MYTWTPLINTADFTGIMTDVGTSATGIISIILVVIGLGILIKTLGR